MKHQTIQEDMKIGDFDFDRVLKALLGASHLNLNQSHPVKRVKFKITFYWE